MEEDKSNLKCRIITYKNATSVKIKNRRIIVGNPLEYNEKLLTVQFAKLLDKDEPDKNQSTASYINRKDKVGYLTFKLSIEGAKALYVALHQEFEKRNLF
jgi:hypothetical protein